MTMAQRTKPLDPQAIRADFPLLGKPLSRAGQDSVPLVYLDSASTTPPSRQVVRAMVETCETCYANVHRGIHRLAERSTELYEGTREKVRAFLNASGVEEIVFLPGTTQAINLVARTWGDANVRREDEILLTVMEHHSNIVPWQQLAERTGVTLRYLPVTDDGQLDLEAAEQILSERTKLLAITAVSNVLGTINPLKKIIHRAHDAGALVLVDGAQAVSRMRMDVRDLGMDFLALSGHKMFGPSGVGVLYGRRELLERMPPFLGGGSMVRKVTLDSFQADATPAKFEAGTPPIVPVIGLGAAIDYMESIGMESIAAHEQQLTSYTWDVLQCVDGLHVLGPRAEQKCPIFSFTVRGVHPDDVATLLDRQGIAVRTGQHCAMPLHERFGISATVRASLSIYNTTEEIDRLGAALRSVGHAFRRRKGV